MYMAWIRFADVDKLEADKALCTPVRQLEPKLLADAVPVAITVIVVVGNISSPHPVPFLTGLLGFMMPPPVPSVSTKPRLFLNPLLPLLLCVVYGNVFFRT